MIGKGTDPFRVTPSSKFNRGWFSRFGTYANVHFHHTVNKQITLPSLIETLNKLLDDFNVIFQISNFLISGLLLPQEPQKLDRHFCGGLFFRSQPCRMKEVNKIAEYFIGRVIMILSHDISLTNKTAKISKCDKTCKLTFPALPSHRKCL